MQITKIQTGITNNQTGFGRRLREDEKADYQKTVERGFEVSGVKQRIAITHGSVFPAVDRDSYMGSPYGSGAKEYIKFLKLNGFNGNQLGPNGALGLNDISPYTSSALNENPLFIDLKPLTTEAYGNILSPETYKQVTAPIQKNDKSYALANQQEAKMSYFRALSESYKNFKKNLAKNQPEAIKLNQEFTEYKDKKGKQTEEEGLFRVLATINGTENFSDWDNEEDRDLMENIRKGNENAKKRYNQLIKRYSRPIEQYQFEQFIVSKQIQENKEFRDNMDFKYFSDLLIGCSQMDVWRYKEAFLPGYSIGAYQGDPNSPHQLWNISVLDPRKLFTGETGINIGGQFIKEKFEHALENCENLRIDHALGLIEPFIYKNASVTRDANGNVIKQNIQGDYISKIHLDNGNRLDYYNDYQHILDKIIFPELEKHGLSKTDPVWENLCSEPDLFKQIYYDRENLPRLIQLEYTKDEFAGNQHWFLIGSHDSIPVTSMLNADGGWRRKNPAWDAMYLAGYLNQDPKRSEDSSAFCRRIAGEVDNIAKSGIDLENADRALINAKFAELFTKEKIQVSFADIFGINEDNIVYNIGGSDNANNWKERIPADFIDKYYKNLSSDHPTALNVPEVLKIAVQAKVDKTIVNYMNSLPKSAPDNEEKINQKRREVYAEFQPLLDKLDYYANILKEKED